MIRSGSAPANPGHAGGNDPTVLWIDSLCTRAGVEVGFGARASEAGATWRVGALGGNPALSRNESRICGVLGRRAGRKAGVPPADRRFS